MGPALLVPVDGRQARVTALTTEGGFTTMDGASLHLLYVEDNLVSVDVMRFVLELRPVWKLLHASLVETGIAAARADHPDLVLLDMNLPDGSGEEVLTTLKADSRTREIPIVILTAGAIGPTARTSLLGAGADDVWIKPHDLDLMLAYLDGIAARAA